MFSYKCFSKTQYIPELDEDFKEGGCFDLGVYLVSVIILFLMIVLVVDVLENTNQ